MSCQLDPALTGLALLVCMATHLFLLRFPDTVECFLWPATNPHQLVAKLGDHFLVSLEQ